MSITCQFCGGDDTHIEISGSIHNLSYWVSCRECQSCGPTASDEATAIARYYRNLLPWKQAAKFYRAQYETARLALCDVEISYIRKEPVNFDAIENVLLNVLDGRLASYKARK